MAKEITGSRYQPGRGPVGGEREVRDRLLRGSRGRCFTDSFYGFRERRYRESEGVRGGPLLGDFWSGIRLWKAVAKEITGSRYQPGRGPVGGEREKSYARGPVGGERGVRDRLLRGARGVSVTGGGLAVAREITGSRYQPGSSTLLHRLFLRKRH